MTRIAPRNFQIADAARERILWVLSDYKRHDKSRDWIPAFSWSTTTDPAGEILAVGPGIAAYDRADIDPDLIVEIRGIEMLFPCPEKDMCRFDDYILDFSAERDLFLRK